MLSTRSLAEERKANYEERLEQKEREKREEEVERMRVKEQHEEKKRHVEEEEKKVREQTAEKLDKLKRWGCQYCECAKHICSYSDFGIIRRMKLMKVKRKM